jgi:hypothetical protein
VKSKAYDGADEGMRQGEAARKSKKNEAQGNPRMNELLTRLLEVAGESKPNDNDRCPSCGLGAVLGCCGVCGKPYCNHCLPRHAHEAPPAPKKPKKAARKPYKRFSRLGR